MSGLDKIKSQILEEAECTANAYLADAAARAEKITAEAKAEVQAETERMQQKSEAAVKNYAERVASSCDMQRKKAVLKAKQEVISQVLEKAYEKVVELPEEAYFDLMRKMLEKYAQPADGEIVLSVADAERMPEGFDKEIQKIAEAKGGKLKVSDETKEMEGGFILVYGGIEENCTIRSMFDAKRDELSDQVQKLLFQ